MRLTARGWRRNVGSHTLAKLDFGSAKRARRIFIDELSINADEARENVTLRWAAPDLKLNGNYSMSAQFSRADVTRLFVELYSNLELDAVVEMLHEAQQQWRNSSSRDDDQ